jgi:UDP-3-O-[3-hydroxymyristoyl] N-acetylglucosamine deacetylase
MFSAATWLSACTFGFMKDVERLWAAGYALGFRWKTRSDRRRPSCHQHGRSALYEFVRHKTLDAIGDLRLLAHALLAASAPIAAAIA